MEGTPFFILRQGVVRAGNVRWNQVGMVMAKIKVENVEKFGGIMAASGTNRLISISNMGNINAEMINEGVPQ